MGSCLFSLATSESTLVLVVVVDSAAFCQLPKHFSLNAHDPVRMYCLHCCKFVCSIYRF